MKIHSQGRRVVCGGYKVVTSQDRGRALHDKPKVELRLQPGNALCGKVTDYLKFGYFPEQIAETLKMIHPNTPSLQVSYETIYTAIHAMPRGELRTEVVSWLRQAMPSVALWPEARTAEGKYPTWSTSATAA